MNDVFKLLVKTNMHFVVSIWMMCLNY